MCRVLWCLLQCFRVVMVAQKSVVVILGVYFATFGDFKLLALNEFQGWKFLFFETRVFIIKDSGS